MACKRSGVRVPVSPPRLFLHSEDFLYNALLAGGDQDYQDDK